MDYETCLETTGLDKDMYKLDEYMNQHGTHCECRVDMEEYLRDWFTSKRTLLKIFKNKLIIEYPIEYEEDINAVSREIRENIISSHEWMSLHSEFLYMMERVLTSSYEKYSVDEDVFVSDISNFFCRAIPLAENRFGIYTELLATSWHKAIKFEPDTKPIKVLTRTLDFCEGIAKAHGYIQYGAENFVALRQSIEKFRVILSQYLNRKTFHGTLCLSIHPLDYMSMSDNGYNWSSCMGWVDGDGDYRVGTLEMMNSPLVVVAYLKGETPWYPCNSEWEWSNKKWRQLFIIHRNFIAGIKGYPYRSNVLTKMCLDRLSALCVEYGWPAYGDYIDSEKHGCRVGDTYIKFLTDLMYNDTECNNFYYVVSSLPERWDYEDKVCLNYSGIARCVKCGGLIDGDADTSEFFCSSCSPRFYCDGCGAEVDRDELIEIDEGCFCPYCVSYCDACGEYFYDGSSRPTTGIDFVFKMQKRWGADHLEICSDCINKIKDDTVIINGANYPNSGIERFGNMRVALPTIDRKYLKDMFLAAEDLVDFSVEQKA